FSANATLWPSCSSVRAISNRLTRLSSTTSRSPFSALRSGITFELRQCPGHLHGLVGEPLEQESRLLEAARARQALELSRQGRQARGAEASRVRLERVCRSPEGVGVPGC